jgi:hypothetical protein
VVSLIFFIPYPSCCTWSGSLLSADHQLSFSKQNSSNKSS